jgi:hypothetical protein
MNSKKYVVDFLILPNMVYFLSQFINNLHAFKIVNIKSLLANFFYPETNDKTSNTILTNCLMYNENTSKTCCTACFLKKYTDFCQQIG